MRSKPDLTLILPNLAPLLQQQLNDDVVGETLKKMMRKGSFQPHIIGLERSLFNHFSVEALTNLDLPMARIRHPEKIAICADPCYLHADRDQLVLFSDQLAITSQEAEALIATIQPLLSDFGATLMADDNEHWTMILQSMPVLTFTALPDVKEITIGDKLLTGADQQDWLRLWNEIQMILFDSPVNQQRIEAGKLPINSLWFWGKGEMVAQMSKWQSVMGQHEFLAPLAKLSQVVHNATIGDLTGLTSGRHLIVCESLDLESDWQQQLQQIEQDLLQPIWQLLRRYQVSSFTLELPFYGQYTLKPIDSWKFW